MSMIAVAVKYLMAAGASPDVVAQAIVDMEAEQHSGPSKAALRTRAWRERKASQNVTVTDGDACDGDVAPPKVPPTPPLNTPEVSEAIASAAPAAPVFTDSRHELWSEGVPTLVQLGVKEREARSNIGRWLKATADDAQAVLSAIQRARDHRVHNAIPWITQALKVPNAAGQDRTYPASGARKIAQDTLVAGMAAALSERSDSRFGGGDPGRWRRSPPTDCNDHEEPGAVPRLLLQHRG